MRFYAQLTKNTYSRLIARLKRQVQPLLEELMKDIIASSLDLDVNIHVLMSNAVEKRLFNCAVRAIKYYLPIRFPKNIRFIFLQLVELSLLVGPLIDLNCTKSKSYNENGNISHGLDIGNRVNNKVL